MKKLMTLAMALTTLAVAADAQAQSRYDFGVFADPNAGNSVITMDPFVATNFYVVAFDLDGQVKGFEFDVSFSNPSITILARNLQAGALNVGAEDNFIVGTGGCFDGDGVWYQMVEYQAGFFQSVAPSDVTVCLGPSTPSSFDPATPGYLQCDGSLVPLNPAQTGGGVYPDGCGVINATDPGSVVTTVEESFGSVKSRF